MNKFFVLQTEQRGLAPILIVILIAVILGGILIYSRIITSPQKTVACTEEAKICSDGSRVGRTGPNCEFAACPGKNGESTSSAEVANLKTYVNTKYGYQIKYPSDWQLEESDNYISLVPPEVNLKATPNEDNPLPLAGVPGITVSIRQIPLGEYPKGNKTEQEVPFITDWKAVTVGGLNGIYYQMHQCAPQCSAVTVLPMGDKQTILISISSAAQEKGYAPVYNQILSTFKFQ